jgi:hypothetical protein
MFRLILLEIGSHSPLSVLLSRLCLGLSAEELGCDFSVAVTFKHIKQHLFLIIFGGCRQSQQ